MQAFNKSFYDKYSFVKFGHLMKGHAAPIQDALFNASHMRFKIETWDLI